MVYVGRPIHYEADSFAYFREAIYASYGNYTSYKYVEETGSWVVFSEIAPDYIMTYHIDKNTAEETVFLAEKSQANGWSGRKRVDVIIGTHTHDEYFPNSTGQEHYNQHSEAFQTILKELDGYHPDITGQEHYHQHSQAIQDILSALDGYEADEDLDERVTIIQNSLDGYASDQTVTEHYHQHSDAINTITKELDGYLTSSSNKPRVALQFGLYSASEIGTASLKTPGNTTIGHLIPFASRLIRASILTDGYTDSSIYIKRNGALIQSLEMDNEDKKIVDLNDPLSPYDTLTAEIVSPSELWNTSLSSAFELDGYTLLLCHMDDTSDNSLDYRNILNSCDVVQGHNGRSYSTTVGADGYTGYFDKAVYFSSASSSWVHILHHTEMEASQATVEFWFKTTTIAAGLAGIFSKDGPTDNRTTIYRNGNQIRLRLDSGYDTGAFIEANRWYHLALVLGTGGVKLFIDGQLVYTKSDKTYGISSNYDGIVLGASQEGVGDKGHVNTGELQEFFDGYICEVRLSNVRRYESNFQPQLTPFVLDANTTGLWHLDETSGPIVYDSDTKTVNLTSEATGSMSELDLSIKKFGTKSWKISASENDYGHIIHDSAFELDEFSVEMWVYPEDDDDGILFAKGDSNTEGGLIVKHLATNDQIQVIYYGESTSRTITTAVNSCSNIVWHHVAVTATDSLLAVYIDGALAGSATLTSDYQNVWTNNKEDLFWCSDKTYATFFKCHLDEIRISNKAREFDGSNINNISLLLEIEEE